MNTWKKQVDILMYVAMCFLASTGLLLKHRLVPGSQGGHGLVLFGLGRHDWGAVHLWTAYTLILLLLVHIILNFRFIKNVVASKKNHIMIILALLGIFVTGFLLCAPIERIEHGEGHSHSRHDAGHGEVTLRRQDSLG